MNRTHYVVFYRAGGATWPAGVFESLDAAGAHLMAVAMQDCTSSGWPPMQQPSLYIEKVVTREPS